MPELESIASPLGAECDPEDTLADILEVLRIQDPVPLVVVALIDSGVPETYCAEEIVGGVPLVV